MQAQMATQKQDMTGLEQLLSPFNAERFLAEYWHRKPLLVQGRETKFSNLPGSGDLPSLLAGKLSGSRWEKGHAFNAQASVLDKTGKVTSVSAVPSMWPELFNAGFSLCFSAVDHLHEDLTRLVKQIAESTNLPGAIYTTCYLTPPCSGSSMHFDSQHNFFLQVSGEKCWRVSKQVGWQDAPLNLQQSLIEDPAAKMMMASMGISVAGPEQTGMEELTLRPGDVLYMPPGFWHEGRTLESHSFHYTLTCMPVGPWQLVMTYLRRLYFANATLRRDMRYLVETGDGGSRALLTAAIQELRQAMTTLEAAEVEEFYSVVSGTETLKSILLLPY